MPEPRQKPVFTPAPRPTVNLQDKVAIAALMERVAEGRATIRLKPKDKRQRELLPS
jgi:hypothetical protein